MIFKKESNFPYPVLASFTDDYPNSTFTFDVTLSELEEEYRFDISYQLKSAYLQSLLNKEKAKLYLVIESKDQKFFELTNTNTIDIPKTRISLDNRTQLQLFIINTNRLSFRDNNEVDAFYDDFKHSIFVEKYSTLALSNIEAFDGEMNKPFELFEWATDENLKSEFKVELLTETIKLIFRNRSYHFMDQPKKNQSLNNHYVYIGLQHALMKMIVDLKNENDDGIDISDMEVPQTPLNKKLYDLLTEKKVSDLHFENIDEVINKVSDSIVERHTNKIREIMEHDY